MPMTAGVVTILGGVLFGLSKMPGLNLPRAIQAPVKGGGSILIAETWA